MNSDFTSKDTSLWSSGICIVLMVSVVFTMYFLLKDYTDYMKLTLHWYACGADGRLLARSLTRCTVTRLPNFLGWLDYHIILAMGLCPRAALCAVHGALLQKLHLSV